MSFSAASLGEVLKAQLPRAATGLVVAVSGGMDSGCLLAAAARLPGACGGLPLRAVHIDHGLQSAAAEFRRVCTAWCAALGIPLSIIAVSVDAAHGASLEAAARAARYAALGGALAAGECLLTAHHAQDQAETFLLQALRGAGVAGLASMPDCRALGLGWHLRPLLEVAPSELEAYAASLGIVGVLDPMNEDLRFDRAYLRGRIWPAIERRWPGARIALARSAAHAAAAQDLLAAAADADLAALGDGAALSVTRLRALSADRRANALRRWIDRAGARPPPAARLHEALRQILEARADQQPAVVWAEHALRRYRDRIFLTAAEPARLRTAYAWDPRAQPVLELGAGLGRLRARSQDGGLAAEELPATLAVRGRRGGERLKPAPRAATQSVQHLCQSQGLPPWTRAALPFVFAGAELIAVGDLWLDARRCAPPGEPGIGFDWQGGPGLP
ncbi:MAG TPA: tRNA lysidine(34) synthetase TilS [Steroidobacteraceae bacterium]|nr:tRNA lysidine(34) synthetase TilS [Steroidobacteraceae bacterium]